VEAKGVPTMDKYSIFWLEFNIFDKEDKANGAVRMLGFFPFDKTIRASANDIDSVPMIPIVPTVMLSIKASNRRPSR
jgi:hypothetical protein